MSATNSTQHFNLATYAPTDVTTWGDFNENMAKIDAALKNNGISNPTSENAVDHVTISLNDDTSFMIEPAQGTNDGQVGRAGVMTSMQASQLAALAEAYKNATQGIILYEDTASTNYVELSETALNYDHLVVVGEYTSEGSASFNETVSVEFHPHGATNAFQLTATDLTTGNTPAQITHQDVWMLNEAGDELELASAQKCVIATQNPNSDTPKTTVTVTPDTTSIFTITKVIGYGKRA